MKRVLLVTGKLCLRGSTLYTLGLARELKHRGHKVALLSPGGLLEDSLEELRIPLLRAPIHGQLWRDLLYLNTYVEGVREFDPELLHVQHQDLAGIGALIARRTGLPWVLTVHAQVRHPLRFPLAEPPWLIAVSEDVRQSLVTAGMVPRERIEVSPNGVTVSLSALEESQRPAEQMQVVGTVNRIARDRGIDLFLQAAREVLDAGCKAYFLVIGEGPAEKEARALSRKLGLTPHVSFALPRSRIPDLFRPMDVFVSASHSEGHGIFLLYAMAEARPVVSTGVGGVLSFLRDGENGLVVPRGDVPSLAQAIERMLREPALARTLAVEGFRDVRERFPLPAMVERTELSYERAVGEPGE